MCPLCGQTRCDCTPILLLIGCAFVLLAVPNASGQSIPCTTYPVQASISGTASGTIGVCISYPDVVASNNATFHVTARVTTPPITGSTPTATLSLQQPAGCTADAPQITGTPLTATSGSQTTAAWRMHMHGPQCTALVRISITTTSSVLQDSVAINTRSAASQQNMALTATNTLAKDLKQLLTSYGPLLVLAITLYLATASKDPVLLVIGLAAALLAAIATPGLTPPTRVVLAALAVGYAHQFYRKTRKA